MDVTIAGFIEFVNAQPADRAIHNQAWCTCAVGMYAREVHNHEIIDPNKYGNSYAMLHADPVLKALWKESGTSCVYTWDDYDTHMSEAVTLMDQLNEGIFGTFGQLQKYIANNR